MSLFLWGSIVLEVVGMIGLWFAGSRPRWGWAIGVAVQPLWVAYSLATKQYGFILGSFAYGAVSARNWRRAKQA